MDIEAAQRITDGGMTFDLIRVKQVRSGSPGEQAGFHAGARSSQLMARSSRASPPLRNMWVQFSRVVNQRRHHSGRRRSATGPAHRCHRWCGRASCSSGNPVYPTADRTFHGDESSNRSWRCCSTRMLRTRLFFPTPQWCRTPVWTASRASPEPEPRAAKLRRHGSRFSSLRES